MSLKVKDENISVNKKISKKWLLVQWLGSLPKDSFDIINTSHVVFDERMSESGLKVGNTIMVKCGKIKSPSIVMQISSSIDVLESELTRLQREILSENSINVIKSETYTPKLKKRRYLEDAFKKETHQHKIIQTADDNRVSKLVQENQKLKADLYEANKIINTMCSNLSSIIQGAQTKMLNQNVDSFSNEDTENTPPKTTLQRSPSTPLTPNNIVPEIEENDKILIGTGKTPIPRYIYTQVNWLSFTAATRKLLMTVFTRSVLATHSLTGKPSPAFIASDMPVKMRLDATKVSDIVEIVSTKCGVSESMVRSAITTKCADENKMYKKRMGKSEKIE